MDSLIEESFFCSCLKVRGDEIQVKDRCLEYMMAETTHTANTGRVQRSLLELLGKELSIGREIVKGVLLI